MPSPALAEFCEPDPAAAPGARVLVADNDDPFGIYSEIEPDCVQPDPMDGWLGRYGRRKNRSLTVSQWLELERARLATPSAKVSANQSTPADANFDFVADSDAGNDAETQASAGVERSASSIYPVGPSTSASLPLSSAPVSASISASISPTGAEGAVSGSIAATISAKPINPTGKRWEQADEIEATKATFQVAHNGGGVAFSLNLSAKKIASLQQAAANDNATRRLSQEMNRQLKRFLGYVPPYGFAFEFNDQDRLHLHGVIVVRDASPEILKLARKALAAAGGKIRGTAGRGQTHTKFLHDGERWAGYTLKSLNHTRRLLGTDKVTFVNRELKQMTRAAWDASLPPRRRWTRRIPKPVPAVPAPAARRQPARASSVARIYFLRSGKLTSARRRVSAVRHAHNVNAHQRPSLTLWRPVPRSTAPPA